MFTEMVTSIENEVTQVLSTKFLFVNVLTYG